jgi:hypothetical protein
MKCRLREGYPPARQVHHTSPHLKLPRLGPRMRRHRPRFLITEQEVLGGTAAAVRARCQSISRRFVGSIGRIFAVSARTSRRRRGEYPRRYEFFEPTLMARGADRC